MEEAVLGSGAMPGGNDIDVIKVNHHGSDTSTSAALASEMLPEAAVVSSAFTRRHKLPKKIALQQFQQNQTYVLITGDAMDPDAGDYAESTATDEDNGFAVSDEAVFNSQGNVTILVAPDGDRYTVTGASFSRTFSAVDGENER